MKIATILRSIVLCTLFVSGTPALANEALSCKDITGTWTADSKTSNWNFAGYAPYQAHLTIVNNINPNMITNAAISFDIGYPGSCKADEGCISANDLMGGCAINKDGIVIAEVNSPTNSHILLTLIDKTHLSVDQMDLHLPSISGTGSGVFTKM